MGKQPGARWRKASYSNGQASCVEVGHDCADTVAVRDTKLPVPSLVLRFTPAA